MRVLAKMGLCLAIACTSTASVADILFNGERIPAGQGGDVVSVTLDPNSGDLVIEVSGWSVAQDGTEPPPPPPPPPPALEAPTPPDGATFWVGLAVSTNLVDQFDPVTFAWNAVGASSCVTRLGDANWRAQTLDPANPTNFDVIMSEAGTDIRFRIFCFDDAGNQVATQQLITVTAAPPPPPPPPGVASVDCSAPSDVTRGSVLEWDEVFNATFPDTAANGDDFFLGRNNYVAIRLETTTEPVFGSVATVPLSGGWRHVSISECPGNFVSGTPSTCSQIQAGGGALTFTMDPQGSGCVIEPSKEYFINITYVDASDADPDVTTTCAASTCLVRYVQSVNPL